MGGAHRIGRKSEEPDDKLEQVETQSDVSVCEE